MENTNNISTNDSSSKSNVWVKIAGIVVVIGLVAVALFKFKGISPGGQIKSANTPSPTPTTETEETSLPSPESTPAAIDNRKYRDGTYSAQGTYRSPAQQETINIELEIKDDQIISAKFIKNATNPTSIKMQTNFEAGFETLVVGKNIDEVSLTVVNGSSLTPKGFMDALSKIKTQAQS